MRTIHRDRFVRLGLAIVALALLQVSCEPKVIKEIAGGASCALAATTNSLAEFSRQALCWALERDHLPLVQMALTFSMVVWLCLVLEPRDRRPRQHQFRP